MTPYFRSFYLSVWSSANLAASGYSGLAALQQVVGNFANVYSTFLTVSIAILRYRYGTNNERARFHQPDLPAIYYIVFDLYDI
jgi:hypothetical protein